MDAWLYKMGTIDWDRGSRGWSPREIIDLTEPGGGCKVRGSEKEVVQWRGRPGSFWLTTDRRT